MSQPIEDRYRANPPVPPTNYFAPHYYSHPDDLGYDWRRPTQHASSNPHHPTSLPSHTTPSYIQANNATTYEKMHRPDRLQQPTDPQPLFGRHWSPLGGHPAHQGHQPLADPPRHEHLAHAQFSGHHAPASSRPPCSSRAPEPPSQPATHEHLAFGTTKPYHSQQPPNDPVTLDQVLARFNIGQPASESAAPIPSRTLDQILARLTTLEHDRDLRTTPPSARNDDSILAALDRIMSRISVLEEEHLQTRSLVMQLGTVPHSKSKAPKVDDAEYFDGSPAQLEIFIDQLDLVWIADPGHWADHHARIRYALSRMRKGTAQKWVHTIQSKYLNGHITWASWSAFLDTLRKTFPGVDRTVQARFEMENMVMDPDLPVQDFFIKWEAEAAHAGINDAGQLVKLKDAITPELCERISNTVGLLQCRTYEEFKAAAILCDDEIRHNKALASRCHTTWEPDIDDLDGRLEGGDTPSESGSMAFGSPLDQRPSRRVA